MTGRKCTAGFFLFVLLINSCVLTGGQGPRVKAGPPTLSIQTVFDGPEDTALLHPWRTGSPQTLETLDDGRRLLKLTLPRGTEAGYRWILSGDAHCLGVLYTKNGADFFQTGDISYGPFTKIYDAGFLSPDGGRSFFTFRRESMDEGGAAFWSTVCFDGVLYPYGVGYLEGAEESKSGYYRRDPESGRIIGHFYYDGGEGINGNQYIRAGDEVFGPYYDVYNLQASPDLSLWLAEVRNTEKRLLVFNGEESFPAEGQHHSYRESGNKKHWGVVVPDKDGCRVEVDGRYIGRYDEVSQIQLSDSGRYGVAFTRNGRSWFNVDGREFAVPGAMESPVFFPDSEDFYYRTYSRQNGGYFVHLGEREWGPYTEMKGVSRWSGEGWLTSAAASNDGSILAFQFQDGEDYQYVQVNEETLGPFRTAWGPYISPDGQDVAFRFTDRDKKFRVWWNGEVFGPYNFAGSLPSAFLEENDDFLVDSEGRIIGFYFNIDGEDAFGIHELDGMTGWGKITVGGKNHIFTREGVYGPFDRVDGFWQSADRRYRILHWTEGGKTSIQVNEWLRGPGDLEFRIEEDTRQVHIINREGLNLQVESIPLELTLVAEKTERKL